MSQRTVVFCDECGVERRESNHWFSLIASPTLPQLSTFHAAHVQPDPAFRLDYCGQRCVLTAMQRWFETGTVVDASSGQVSRAARPAAPPVTSRHAPRLLMASR